MRTALFLLLLLSVAAVPGSIFPQRNIDAGRVADYIAQNPTTSPWLDRLGFFDVYSSPWFSAIYLLLFVSLVGCIVPRTRVHVAALRATPPRAPARLSRLDEHAEVVTDVSPEEALAVAREVLRGKRFRLHSHDSTSISGESGYLRETGNLVFHLALTGIIVGMAVGHVFGWRGDIILAEGDRFASSAGTYNTISPGPWVDTETLPPFVLGLDRLDVQFNEAPGRGFGMPTAFTDDADFSGFTVEASPEVRAREPRRESLKISEVLHEAFVAVDEEGTEAAAATAVMARGAGIPAPPVPFVVDRPFLFAIHTTADNTPLFVGRVTDPR
jgi:cytochrome c biogenesis protein